MKPFRTSLLEDAVSGSVRPPAQGSVAYAAYTQSAADPAATQSGALRERLTQTRARIARAHAERPPQIDVDWDPDEPPTRLYQGESLALPRASHARAQSDPTATSTRMQASARGSHTRVRAEQVPTAHVHAPVATLTAAHASDASSPHQAAPGMPPAEPQTPARVTLPALALWLRRETSALRARLSQLYAASDHTDAALRKRVAYGSLVVLLVAAVSGMLLANQVDTRELVSSEASQARITPDGQLMPVPQSASVSISSDPAGALIFLNGQASNQVTPAKLTELPPGRHVIGLKLAGYAETKEALQLPADALVSIKLAALNGPRFVDQPTAQHGTSRSELRAQARELARERRAAARAAKVLVRYRARMGLPPDPVAQELVDAFGPTQSAE